MLHEASAAAYREAGLDPIAWDTLGENGKRWREIGANAVLRAFGNGAEALGRVREQILAAPGEACEYYAAIIDDEIAKLT